MSEKYIIPTPGDVIAGKYHIERELGRGAYGVVFRARQEGIDRHVALKTLLPKAFLETDIVERFEREAQFVGRLSHPNIVGVHDYGRHENLLYMSVEYVEGETLDEIIAREGPLEPERVRKLVYQLVSALEHAHARGIVHRDLKPANIVIVPRTDPETGEESEMVKVLDFGIAKLIQAEAEEEMHETLTQAGTVLGTPHYMSPETIVGDTIDHRADIYSLGVIIYEMLTGERPFGAKNSPGVMVKHLRDEPPELPAHLQHSCWGEAVRGCLEKRPEKRIQSAVRVREILERRDEGMRTATPQGSTASARAMKRPENGKRRLVAAIAVGAVFAVVLAALFQLLPSDSGPDAKPDGAGSARPALRADKADNSAEDNAAADQASSEQGSNQAQPDEMRFDPGELANGAEARPDAGDAAGTAVPAEPSSDRPDERSPAARADKGDARPPKEASAKPNAATKRAEKTATVTLELTTTPTGARVMVGDTPVGSTPLEHKLPKGSEPVTLEFSHIGYRSKFRSVVPDHDQTVDVELEKGRLKLIP